MGTAIATVTLRPDQQKVYDAMPAAWKSKTNQVLSLMSNLVRSGVLDRHTLGEHVRDMAGDESRYGEAAVPSLAVVLGESAASLWAYRTLATTYTRKQLEKLLDRSSKAGHPLAWSHIRLLAAVESPKVRAQLEVAVVDKRLSADDLSKKIQRVRGKRRDAGRQHQPPRSPIAGLGQIDKFATDVLAKADGWENIVFGHFEKVSADEVQDEEMEQLAGTVQKLHDAFDKISHLKAQGDKAMTALRRRRTAAEGAAAKPAKAPASNGHASNGHGPAVVKRQRPNMTAMLGSGKPKKKKAKLQRA